MLASSATYQPSFAPNADSAAQQEYDAGLWEVFANPNSEEEFCQAWLAVLCRQLTGVNAGLVLLTANESNSFAPVALWPDVQRDLSYLGKSAEQVLAQRRGVTQHPPTDAPANQGIQVGYPIELSDALKGAVVLDVTRRSEAELRALLRQLHWGMAWLYDLFHRRTSASEEAKSERIGSVMAVMATAMRHKKLKQALFDVVNDVAERMDCSRVIIGITNHDAIELSATSHATWFEKNTRLAQLYTVAMEETRDRLETIVVPQPEGMSVPALAHSELAAATEAGALICCPLRKGADCIGVILLERGEGEAFSDGDIEWVETLATMLPNVIDLRRRSERGFLGYLGNDLRALATRFFGPGHLTWKAIGLLVIVGIAILTFVHSDYRVAAKTVIEGEIQRAAVAPFEGFIGQSFVRAGDTVKTGQVLCALDDKDLKLERTRWASERDQHLQKYREALATRDLPATQVLQAQIKQAEAQLALVEQKLSRTKITAPFDGIVVSGDLTQMIGAPVETGKKLFEVAPLDRYRVILKVDEREIRYVELGQHGKLMMSGVAGEAMPFSVKKITPVATAESGQNFFRVEAQLANVNISMRPGMEGVGKISIGEQPLWWIMTRSFGDWLRLALWNWMP